MPRYCAEKDGWIVVLDNIKGCFVLYSPSSLVRWTSLYFPKSNLEPCVLDPLRDAGVNTEELGSMFLELNHCLSIPRETCDPPYGFLIDSAFPEVMGSLGWETGPKTPDTSNTRRLAAWPWFAGPAFTAADTT